MAKGTNPRAPEALSKRDLSQLVANIQAILWMDIDSSRSTAAYWDPDKVWDSEFIEMVAEQMSNYGLRPTRRKKA